MIRIYLILSIAMFSQVSFASDGCYKRLTKAIVEIGHGFETGDLSEDAANKSVELQGLYYNSCVLVELMNIFDSEAEDDTKSEEGRKLEECAIFQFRLSQDKIKTQVDMNSENEETINEQQAEIIFGFLEEAQQSYISFCKPGKASEEPGFWPFRGS